MKYLSELANIFPKMYARGPSAIKTPETTTKMAKTTAAEESFSTGLHSFEEWKSYLNYLVYFRRQQFLEKELQRMNEGRTKSTVTTTTATKQIPPQILPVITTRMPEITRYSPFYIRFGWFFINFVSKFLQRNII